MKTKPAIFIALIATSSLSFAGSGTSEHEHKNDHETKLESTTEEKKDAHSDGHSAHDGKNQEKEMLFTGLKTDAAQAVISFHEAINKGDSDRARSYLDDAIIIFEGGGVERSADEYASHHMLSDMAFLKNLTITSLEHQVKVDGNMAVSISRSKMQGVFKDKEIDMNSMETLVLKRVKDKWKIIHIHWSN